MWTVRTCRGCTCYKTAQHKWISPEVMSRTWCRAAMMPTTLPVSTLSLTLMMRRCAHPNTSSSTHRYRAVDSGCYYWPKTLVRHVEYSTMCKHVRQGVTLLMWFIEGCVPHTILNTNTKTSMKLKDNKTKYTPMWIVEVYTNALAHRNAIYNLLSHM